MTAAVNLLIHIIALFCVRLIVRLSYIKNLIHSLGAVDKWYGLATNKK